jgi:hypothetical protein
MITPKEVNKINRCFDILENAICEIEGLEDKYDARMQRLFGKVCEVRREFHGVVVDMNYASMPRGEKGLVNR